jgi:hypothetical protein
MSCPNNHPEDQITEHQGKRVCKACRALYTNQNNKRRVQAIKTSQKSRHDNINGRLRRKTNKHIQNRHNAVTRVANKVNSDPTSVGDLPKEHNNEQDDHS